MTVTPFRATRIFDMDGTLLECGIYYDRCLADGAAVIEARTGIPAATAEKLIRDCDLAAVQAPGHSWGRDRFPRSFEAAAYAAGRLVGWDAATTEALARALYFVGNSVFDADYALYDGVIEQLERDRAAGWQLVLYTKGDHDVQQMKIDKHCLTAYFDAIYVVPAKNVEVLRRIVGERNVDIATSWMVGDSKKDDIAPAQALGLNTALIDVGNHSWSYNDSDIDPPTLILRSVTELPMALDAYAYGALQKNSAA